MIHTAKRLHNVEEYYFSKKLREVRSLILKGKPVINMGIGSPDLSPSPNVIEALKEALNDPSSHQYQSYQGLPELRRSIAVFYKKYYNVNLNPQTEILPLMGSKEGIMHISMAFLNEGDQVLIPDPGYPTYSSVTKLVGGVPVYYDLKEENKWLPDLKALKNQDLSKVKIMWLNYPHMPTGAKSNASFFDELILFAKEHNILLINDNPYSFILNDQPQSMLALKESKEVLLELNSLSKTFNMAGWRIGMVMGNETYLKAILQVKSNMDSGMFYGIQKGAISALNSSEDWFLKLNKVYKERRDLIFELADKLNCTYDVNASGMFVWAKLPEGAPASETFIDSILYEKDIFITPGTVFGSNGEGYIRFSLCVDEDKIREAICRFKND